MKTDMFTGKKKSVDTFTGTHHKALMSDEARYQAFKKRDEAFSKRVKGHALKNKALHQAMMKKMNKK